MVGAKGGCNALFLMPSFPRHARRRNMQNIEAFYNPDGIFDRVLLLSLEEEGEESAPDHFGSVRVLSLGDARPHPHRLLLGESRYGYVDACASRVLEIAREQDVDLLVQRYGSPLWHGVPIVWAAGQLGKPSVITYQSESKVWEKGLRGLARRAADAAIHRYLRTRATHVWAVSESLRETLVADGVDPGKTIAIPNKDDLDRYSIPASAQVCAALFEKLDVEIRDAAPLFLVVGRLIPEKNHGRVIQAFAKALEINPSARCLIVGAGPLEAELRSLIRSAGIEHSLWIRTSLLTQDELAVLYQRAAALLFCSTSEGQGRVVYEALASGTPVIGADIGPVREMIDREKIGELVNPLDTRGIAAAIISYAKEATSSDVASECRSAARKFDLHSINPREASFYASIMAGETEMSAKSI